MSYEFNINSDQQLEMFLYKYLKLSPIKQTSGGKTENKKNSTDVSVITHHAEKDKNKFCEKLLTYKKIRKARGTYLADISRWIQEGTLDGKEVFLVHGDFSLNTTETNRSSSSSPNQQNNPKHGFIVIHPDDLNLPDKKKYRSIAYAYIRHVYYVGHEDYILSETDYEGAEVKSAANLSLDPQLILDLNNKLDMHSFWTNDIFGWDYSFSEIKDKYKDERYIVKNTWTFANFYGASATSIAREFRKFDVYKNFVLTKWKNFSNRKGTFDSYFEEFSENHFKECQERFYQRYHVFKSWQDGLIDFYNSHGYIETLLGFRRYHPMKRNEILNTPIQGTSFHLLLNACIRIQKEIIKYKMKTKLVGQIHDSLLSLIHKDEIIDYKDMVDEIMCHHDLPIPQEAELGTDWEMSCNNWYKLDFFPFYQIWQRDIVEGSNDYPDKWFDIMSFKKDMYFKYIYFRKKYKTDKLTLKGETFLPMGKE